MSASLASECNEVKERYDTCFLKWYSEKYLRNTATTDECEPLFRQYKTCLTKALKDRGIDQMLEEARADNKENDAEYMKPSALAPHVPNSDVKLMTICKNLTEVVTKPFRIIDMPPELRLKTLSYLVEDRLAVFSRGFYNSPTGIALPGIAYASSSVHAEYLALALEATTFTIHTGAGNDRFQNWLGGPDLSIFH
ncbi:Mitochondrial distribution and morphology protein 35 [Elasticomyces elasticus]|nr:Mitochondrial distribution and morphology protein 35 [Elasticomyces elasticus]